MFIPFVKLQKVSGVAGDGTFTVDVPVGFTYHDFIFLMGGTIFDKSHISDLKLLVNGIVRQHLRTATELETRNKFDRLSAVTSAQLRWPMGRAGLDLREARERTYLGTGISEAQRAQLQSMTGPNAHLYDPVEVTSVQITGVITGATAPTLEVWVNRSAPRPTNVLQKIRNFVRNPSGAGDFEISDLPLNEPLSRVIFKDSAGAGDISRVQLVVNSIQVFDRTPVMNSLLQTDGVRTPQAGYFVYDPAEDGAGNNAPPVGPKDDVRWIITCTGAMTLDIQYETIGYLNS